MDQQQHDLPLSPVAGSAAGATARRAMRLGSVDYLPGDPVPQAALADIPAEQIAQLARRGWLDLPSAQAAPFPVEYTPVPLWSHERPPFYPHGRIVARRVVNLTRPYQQGETIPREEFGELPDRLIRLMWTSGEIDTFAASPPAPDSEQAATTATTTTTRRRAAK